MYTLKKSLGQHFLVDENVARAVVEAVKSFQFQRLLEVGPGGGALTKYFLKIPEMDLKCIEIDEEKILWLQTNFPALRGSLIHQDILSAKPPFDREFLVAGNFPYNISSQILFKMIDWREKIIGVVGMFQKEVAERVAAKEGGRIYGVTSVLIQAFFEVIYLFEVDERSFSPPPKVKSAVIKLLPKPPPAMRSQTEFFQLVKTAFNQRRKKLRNAVKALFDDAVLAEPLFDKRAEQLTVLDFAELTFRMRKI